MSNPRLVWVQGLTGKPTAQIWHEDLTTGTGKLQPFLSCTMLTENEVSLGLDTLAKKYPYRRQK